MQILLQWHPHFHTPASEDEFNYMYTVFHMHGQKKIMVYKKLS